MQQWLGESVDIIMIVVLGLMSMLALAVAIERWLFYRQVDIDGYAELKSLELQLSAKLHLIATVGSNAPYVGLLGTVMGIMLTFQTMGTEGFMDTGRIMVGLSMALKATAAGLLVAIPSVIAYNLLQRRARVLIMQWEIRHEKH